MLLNLSIKNFAIIKFTEIDFTDGMTVLTGETGAGKSILLDALSFVLGARLEKIFLREGEITEVSATFCIKNNSNAQNILDDLFIEHDGECDFRRVVHKSKQSKLFINGSVVKASDVQKISDKLINIYSQHSHQDLLDHKSQLTLLDTFAGNDKILTDVSQIFNDLNTVKAQINVINEHSATQNSKKELTKYKLEELLTLELEENEFDELSQQQEVLSKVDEISYALNYVSESLYDGDDSLVAKLSAIEKEANKLDANTFTNLQELIAQTKVYAIESYNESTEQFENLENDPKKLVIIETRMSQIYDFSRKHNIEAVNLYNHILELQDELDSFSQGDDDLKLLLAQQTQLEEMYDISAAKLTKSRVSAAQIFSKNVEKNIRSLNIPKGSFIVEIGSSGASSSNGVDSCDFMINFNTGDNFAQIKKVASGGELSRIGLSIQAVSAEKRSYPTLVFDEVDVGISGATAEIVGKLLKKLSEKLQVLCITHQAQVAAQGYTHLHVSKKYLKDTTESSIIKLSDDQRVSEIAKIVGGVDISENTLQHARDLLASK